MADELEGGAERRQLLTLDVMQRTGIDEAVIRRLVDAFYAEVRADPLIGPIFNAHVADWDRHLGQMCDFWSSVALMTGRYHGRPMGPHIRIGVESAHFNRWLALFEEVALRECPERAAAHFVERAYRIAESFELGIATHRGDAVLPRRRARPAWLSDLDQRAAGSATA